MQIHHLQSGAFGMAYLERDNATGDHVAIKYIPRGSTVRGARGGSGGASRRNPEAQRARAALCSA